MIFHHYLNLYYFILGKGRNPGPKPGRPRVLALADDNHKPEAIPPTTKKYPSKRCVLCYKSGKRTETRLECRQCVHRPALCAHPCFAMYHNEKE